MIDTPNTGLVIKPHFANLIVDGEKSWELRGAITHKRGRVAIIASTTGTIIGEVEIIRCMEAPKSFRARHITRSHHRLTEGEYSLMNKWRYAWVLDNAIRYDKPISYKHPQGAVTWVANLAKRLR